MEKKKFETYLILNYKTKQFRVIKSKNAIKNIKHVEIPIRVSLNLSFPEPIMVEAKGDVELGETKASEIVLGLMEEKETK